MGERGLVVMGPDCGTARVGGVALGFATELRALAARLATPVDFVLLGKGRSDVTQAVELIVGALDRPSTAWPTWGLSPTPRQVGLLRGLFIGGTLCDGAMLIASQALEPIRSNIPLEPELGLDASMTADSHLMIDFADDALRQGRAHPMIDPRSGSSTSPRHRSSPRQRSC